MKKLPAQPLSGLMDGFEVLRELAISADPISCKHISEKLGLEITKVNRILKTLDFMGLAYRNKSRHYLPGPGIHVLAVQSMIGSGLLRRALPVLEDLRKYKLTVALGVLWRDSVSYLYHNNASKMEAFEAIGRLAVHPAEASSIGIALLSELENAEISTIYEGREISFDAIDKCRAGGFAYLTNAQGNFSLAVKLGNPAYAAIALSGIDPAEDISKYVHILNESARKINENS